MEGGAGPEGAAGALQDGARGAPRGGAQDGTGESGESVALGAGENPEGGQTESGNAETAAAVDNPGVPAASERTASEEAASPPPRETRAVQLPLPAAPSNGLLTINAQPVYAYVEVDGIELPKSTPIFQHPRAPGRHVLTIRREGYETVVDTVEITAGDETRRSYVLIAN